MTTRKRKPIAIAMVREQESQDGFVMVIADDGTIWSSTMYQDTLTKWVAVDPLPQDEKK